MLAKIKDAPRENKNKNKKTAGYRKNPIRGILKNIIKNSKITSSKRCEKKDCMATEITKTSEEIFIDFIKAAFATIEFVEFIVVCLKKLNIINPNNK